MFSVAWSACSEREKILWLKCVRVQTVELNGASCEWVPRTSLSVHSVHGMRWHRCNTLVVAITPQLCSDFLFFSMADLWYSTEQVTPFMSQRTKASKQCLIHGRQTPKRIACGSCPKREQLQHQDNGHLLTQNLMVEPRVVSSSKHMTTHQREPFDHQL